MAELPSGTVTFLFTDIEGSTRLWEEHPDAMRDALARHDEILRIAIESHGGYVVKTTGDGFHAVFATAAGGLAAATSAQLGLRAEPWTATGPLRVRMGLHTCEAQLRDGDYYGSAVNRAARLMSVAHGGQVVLSAVSAELVRAGDLNLLDLGEHRLRDLARAERVFQLCVDGLPSEFPPLYTLDAFPGNLPAQLSSFVGRESELRSVAKDVYASRLVTLVGVGGVGKTRLAIQVAAEVLPEHGDGAWLCELAGADDAESMHQLVAATLGVVSRPGLDMRDSVVEFLGPKEVLLVLDNCEHVIDAAAGLVTPILGRCPGVRVLATSREPLGVEGERVAPLRSMGLPQASQLEEVAASEAVRLFVERADAARPGFALHELNAPAISEVCRRLDGVPLALELAAARVAAMTPAEIAAHLDERFRLLAGRRRGAVERHQTLRATLDWSYSLLEPVERAVFDRLGVFAASFDADDAVAVAADGEVESWDVFDTLASLAAKSMLVVESGDDESTRYRLLETMRHYARERLTQEDDPDCWRTRHAEHYAQLAEAMGVALNGPDELAWRPRVAAALDDLRAAVSWSLDGDGDHAIRIVAALAIQAAQQETAGVGAWAERCTERAQSAPAALRTAVLSAAAWEEMRKGDPAALATASNSLRDGLPHGCPATYLPHLVLCSARGFAGQIEEALAAASEGRAALDAIQAPPNGHAHLYAVETPFAPNPLKTAEAALRAAERASNPTALAIGWWAVGWSCSVDQPDRAASALEKSIALTRAGAGDGVFALALAMRAALAARRNERSEAFSLLVEAGRWGRNSGNRLVIAALIDIGIQVTADFAESRVAAVLAGVHEHAVAGLSSLVRAEQTLREDKLARMRDMLGETMFTAAYERGAAMSYDEVVAYLLSELDRLSAEVVDG